MRVSVDSLARVAGWYVRLVCVSSMLFNSHYSAVREAVGEASCTDSRVHSSIYSARFPLLFVWKDFRTCLFFSCSVLRTDFHVVLELAELQWVFQSWKSIFPYRKKTTWPTTSMWVGGKQVRAHSYQSVMNMIFRRWTELHIIVFALEIGSSGVRLGAGLEKLRSPSV
jgi:hypothetical protein